MVVALSVCLCVCQSLILLFCLLHSHYCLFFLLFRSGGITFFPRVHFLCRLLVLFQYLFHSSFTAAACKRHWLFHQKCRLQLNMQTPLTQRSWSGLTILSRHSLGTNQRKKLTHSSSWKARPQSSQLAWPLWTDPWHKSKRLELVHANWSPL